MFDVCTTGDKAHIDTIFKFLPHTRQHGCIDILHCCNDPCLKARIIAAVFRVFVCVCDTTKNVVPAKRIIVFLKEINIMSTIHAATTFVIVGV
jgi:hypothetical protein